MLQAVYIVYSKSALLFKNTSGVLAAAWSNASTGQIPQHSSTDHACDPPEALSWKKMKSVEWNFDERIRMLRRECPDTFIYFINKYKGEENYGKVHHGIGSGNDQFPVYLI